MALRRTSLQVFAMLRATDFTLTDDIRAVVGNMFSGVLETEVLEQMFQRDRKS